jgi:uncharacterized protein YlzI (FlbEa/FlbD family)
VVVMNVTTVVATVLVQLSAPDGHPIWVNPNEVLELHAVRDAHREHFAPGAKCIIDMSDGKTLLTGEACDEVLKKIHP